MPTETPFALVQVAPPGQGGVFDYLQCLKAEWAAQGTASHVLPLSEALARDRPLSDRLADCAGGQRCAVVLHFSGYGYGRRGLCFWLLDELKTLKARRGDTLRLVVVFHELFATGEPPWRSAFWLSRLQALIATRLARMADALWTNTEQHARWLRETVGAHAPVHVQPVFSNVGEPAGAPPFTERRPQALVFGSASTRQRALDGLRAQVPALQCLGIESVVEVGGGGRSRALLTALPSQYLGPLGTPALSQLLLASRFGVLDYPARFLGKSGVFAAYAAHGCAVLNTLSSGADSDALVAGRHYLSLPALSHTDLEDAPHEARVQNLTRWYSGHGLSQQARSLLALASAWPA